RRGSLGGVGRPGEVVRELQPRVAPGSRRGVLALRRRGLHGAGIPGCGVSADRPASASRVPPPVGRQLLRRCLRLREPARREVASLDGPVRTGGRPRPGLTPRYLELMTERTPVGIIGAATAGLMLSHLLQ